MFRRTIMGVMLIITAIQFTETITRHLFTADTLPGVTAITTIQDFGDLS